MVPAILVLISSTIGIIGYLISNDIMFYIGGSISFIDLLRYTTLNTMLETKQKIGLIKKNKYFQSNQNSPVYYARNVNDLKSLINKYVFGNVLVRVISFIIILGLLFYFFSWEAFIWIGILGGFGYLITIIKIIDNE